MGTRLSHGALLGEWEVLGASLVAKEQEDKGRGGQGRGEKSRGEAGRGGLKGGNNQIFLVKVPECPIPS